MNQYTEFRLNFINDTERIIDVEKIYFDKLFKGLIDNAQNIKEDFDKTISIKDYWLRYAPKQRGHKPRGTSLPWGEVGEKVLDAYLYKTINSNFIDYRFIGLPYGHDLRFTTENAFIHIDTKSTGPTDNQDEVVSSPNQVSGDGISFDNFGFYNSKVQVFGQTKTMDFQPELPPFYIIENKPYLTITFYLKCVYKVISLGNQPLDYLELICVPNGLLMFDTLHYAKNVKGLLTPGKDILTSKHKRTRIKLNPLSHIANWRCKKIKYKDNGTFEITDRQIV